MRKETAIADKPRDAFVQYAMEWLKPPKTRPSRVWSYAEFGRSITPLRDGNCHAAAWADTEEPDSPV